MQAIFRFKQVAIRRLGASAVLLWVVAGAVLAPITAAQGPTGTLVFQTVSGGAIYAVNADGSHLRYLTNGMDPALSPDGRWVAFTRWDNPQHSALGSLWVINVDGSGERLILGDLHQPKAPVWSPDGNQIALSVQQGGRLQPEPKCSRDLPSEPLLADEDGNAFHVVVERDGGEIEIKFCYILLPHPFWRLRLVDVPAALPATYPAISSPTPLPGTRPTPGVWSTPGRGVWSTWTSTGARPGR